MLIAVFTHPSTPDNLHNWGRSEQTPYLSGTVTPTLNKIRSMILGDNYTQTDERSALTTTIPQEREMVDLYSELKKKTGHKCFTLTQNKPAVMEVDDWKITIVYPTGGKTVLPRPMVNEAIHRLQVKGMLTLKEVHNELTNQNGPRTDRLMAVLRELPGVTFTAKPRTLFYKTKQTP